jgi:enoyl-CoA hydratase/carnithine racemase
VADARHVAGYVSRPELHDYADKYRDHFALHRRGGILEARMHTRGGPAVFSHALHNAWGQLWQEAGNDPANEVLIITGTGDAWIAGIDPSVVDIPLHAMPADSVYEQFYDAHKLIENLIFAVDIPTIAAVNGPGFHTEFALLCDITLCTPGTVFTDLHFAVGQAPGDGQGLALQGLLGVKRAAYAMYASQQIDALTALNWGLVNEVVPDDQLMPRAHEIAAMVMKSSRTTRRLTHAIVTRPWKRLLAEDEGFGLAHMLFGSVTDREAPGAEAIL